MRTPTAFTRRLPSTSRIQQEDTNVPGKNYPNSWDTPFTAPEPPSPLPETPFSTGGKPATEPLPPGTVDKPERFP